MGARITVFWRQAYTGENSALTHSLRVYLTLLELCGNGHGGFSVTEGSIIGDKEGQSIILRSCCGGKFDRRLTG